MNAVLHLARPAPFAEMPPMKITPPWSSTAEEITTTLRGDPMNGLPSDEAARRLEHLGPNLLPAAQENSAWITLFAQFRDWMIGLLAAAALISLLVGDAGDAVLILLIIIANALIGFLQERRAEQAVRSLRNLTVPQCTVRRDGETRRIPAKQLVVGDLIELAAGDAVPADCRLLNSVETTVDESPLTGESLPVDKRTTVLAPETPLAERVNMLFSGTTLSTGHATALVTATGQDTELGQIAELVRTARPGPTPLQSRLSRLSRLLGLAVLGICLALFLLAYFRAEPVARTTQLATELLLTSVSLAVAAIPEGMPAIVTIVLALGARRMAVRHAIIRRLPAVETLGSVTCICTDKTGTLTRNQMAVTEICPPEDSSSTDQTDTGQNPEGSPPRIRGILTAAVLCNDARRNPDGTIVGTATEAAFVESAEAHQVPSESLRKLYPRIGEIPFSSDRKRMSTGHTSQDGRSLIITKGAAEQILSRCTGTGTLAEETLSLSTNPDPNSVQPLKQKANQEAARGRRVLAVAAAEIPDAERFTDKLENDLTALGLLIIEDPLRPEVPESIRQCHSAGIRVLMMTGDHAATAEAIARQAGIITTESDAFPPTAVGSELEDRSDQETAELIGQAVVFARVTPEHKIRIVRFLQSQEQVVAMTGDGVNDAPALRQADIGVAMGITGTDVSREAAAMVLSDDNFATIVAAVEEGRVVYDNIRKFVVYLLTANLSEILVITGALLLDMPLPLLPVQILWINLVTDGLPALALGFEAAEDDVMKRPPNSRRTPLLRGGSSAVIPVTATAMSLICLALFFAIYDPETPKSSLITARTAVFTCLAGAQLAFVFAVRSAHKPAWRLGWLSNYRLTVAAIGGYALQILLIYTPLGHRWFHTAPLPFNLLAVTTVAALAPWLITELLFKQRSHPTRLEATYSTAAEGLVDRTQ